MIDSSTQGKNAEVTDKISVASVKGASVRSSPPREPTRSHSQCSRSASSDCSDNDSDLSTLTSTSTSTDEHNLSEPLVVDISPTGETSIQGAALSSDQPCPQSIRVIFRESDDVFASSYGLHRNNSLGFSEISNIDVTRLPIEQEVGGESDLDVCYCSDSDRSILMSYNSKDVSRPAVGPGHPSSTTAKPAFVEPGTLQQAMKQGDPSGKSKSPEVFSKVLDPGEVLDETTFHSEKNWKWYRGGFGVDPMSVFRFLECPFSNVHLRIGVNLMFDTKDKTGLIDDIFLLSKTNKERHTITLNGIMTPFFTVPNMLKISQRSECEALEVELVYLYTSSFRKRNMHLRIISPLERCLLTKLRSGRSAVTLFNGDIRMGACLLMFDILSAAITCWIDFLRLVGRKSAWQPRSFKELESAEEYRPLPEDREHIADFARSIRDLLQATEVTVKTIETDEKFIRAQGSKFQRLLLYQRLQRDVLSSAMKDVEDNMDNMVTRTETLLNRTQTASLKRLTLVASVFLPLTTACSLLSMTNRVNEIGAIWWDWLGIVLIIGFVVITGYRAFTAWHNFWNQSHTQLRVRSMKRNWHIIKAAVLLEEEEDEAEKRLLSSDAAYTHDISLVPLSSRRMFRLSKYLFIIGAVTSFLVGMFVKVSTGAEALGYSIAGTVLLTMGTIVLWRIFRGIVSKLSKAIVTRRKGRIVRTPVDRKDNQSNQPSDSHRDTKKEESVDIQREIRRGRRAYKTQTRKFCGIILPKTVLGAFAMFLGLCVILPMLVFGQIVYRFLALFFGRLVFKVAWSFFETFVDLYVPGGRTLIKAIQVINRTVQYAVFRKQLKSSDIEAGRSRSHSRSRSHQLSSPSRKGSEDRKGVTSVRQRRRAELDETMRTSIGERDAYNEGQASGALEKSESEGVADKAGVVSEAEVENGQAERNQISTASNEDD